MTRRHWRRGAWLAAALVLEGCRACNEAGCDSTLWLQLREASSARLRHGSYAITIVADGEELHGSCVVAATGSSCEGLDTILFIPAYGDPPNQLIELRFEEDPPANLELAVTLDGTSVLVAEVVPVYERGDYCDESLFATVDLVLEPG